MPGMVQPERILTRLAPDILIVAVKSLFTGAVNTMTLPITEREWNSWQSGQHIQHAMPHLTPDQREFLLSGATPEEWDALYGSDD